MKNKKGAVPIIAIAVGVILIGAVVGSAALYTFRNLKEKNQENGNKVLLNTNLQFTDGTRVFEALKSNFPSVKSFAFHTKIRTRTDKELFTGDYKGEVILPETFSMTGGGTNISKYNDRPNFQVEKPRTSSGTTIIVDNNIYGTFEGQWVSMGTNRNKDLEKYYEQQNLPSPEKYIAPKWLTLDYAINLEYAGFDSNTSLHHYKVILRAQKYYDALKPIRKFGFESLGVSATGNNTDAVISGDVWVDQQMRVAREVYSIYYFDAADAKKYYGLNEPVGVVFEVSYSDYGKDFEIKAPKNATPVNEVGKTKAELSTRNSTDTEAKTALSYIRAPIEVYAETQGGLYGNSQSCNSGIFAASDLQSAMKKLLIQKELKCLATNKSYSISFRLPESGVLFCTSSNGQIVLEKQAKIDSKGEAICQ